MNRSITPLGVSETAQQQSGIVHPAVPVPALDPHCPLSTRGCPYSLSPRSIQPLRKIQGTK